MKISYAIFILMVLAIAGCTVDNVSEVVVPEEEGVTEEQPQDNIVMEIPEETETAEDEPETAKKEAGNNIENIIKIKEDGFHPGNITIYKGETVTWYPDVQKISNNQPRMIACYSEGYRIFLGERLTKNGQKSTFKFEEPGDYLCMEFIYGLRGNIKVKSFSRPLITGAAVGVVAETKFLPMMMVVGLILFGAMYSKKKKFF